MPIFPSGRSWRARPLRRTRSSTESPSGTSPKYNVTFSFPQGISKLKNGEMCFLGAEHTLGELGTAGEAVGKIQRLGNHDAGVAVGPVRWGGALKSDADAELQRGKIAAGCAIVVGMADD